MAVGTLIKVLPFKRQMGPDTEYDSLVLWYRDEQGKKLARFVDRARVPYSIIKDKESDEATAPKMFIEKDKVEKSETYSDLLYRCIAEKTNSFDYYDKVMTSGQKNKSNIKNILKHPYVYDADMDVADRYIKNFMEEFEPNPQYHLHKCYMDIEVDLMPNGFKDQGFNGFPEEDKAPCPINIITMVDGNNFDIHTYIHRNPLNQQLLDFEKNLDSELRTLFHMIKSL